MDGWQCSLHRLPPKGHSPGEPLLLIPALCLNRFALDRTADQGAPTPLQALHEAGFDLYILEHRGSLSSWPPDSPSTWDVETIACQELPAALELIQERTGFSKVGVLGFGMGGQILLIALALDPTLPVACAATVASAVIFPRLPRSAFRATRLLRAGIRFPLRTTSRLLSPLADPSGRWERHLGLGDLAGPELRSLLQGAAEDLESGVLAQVRQWYSAGKLVDQHDRLDYLEALHTLGLPFLVIAARGDRLCPPEAAFPLVAALAPGSAEALELPEGPSHAELMLCHDPPALLTTSLVAHFTRQRISSW